MGESVKQSDKDKAKKQKTILEQYEEEGVAITRGHNSDLKNVPVPHYTEEDHGTWAIMFERQKKQLPGRASEDFLKGLNDLAPSEERIPTLLEVSDKLSTFHGWKLTRVEGLVPDREFFECLDQKLFPCTDFIRKREELEYTPSPDMFHDMVGHLPLLTNKTWAEFYHFYGKIAKTASDEQLIKLQRIYWFTVEFGLTSDPKGLRIYGSGILSSHGEARYCLTDKVEKVTFDFDKVTDQYYEIFHMQPILYVIPSREWLLDEFRKWAIKENLLSA